MVLILKNVSVMELRDNITSNHRKTVVNVVALVNIF